MKYLIIGISEGRLVVLTSRHIRRLVEIHEPIIHLLHSTSREWADFIPNLLQKIREGEIKRLQHLYQLSCPQGLSYNTVYLPSSICDVSIVTAQLHISLH